MVIGLAAAVFPTSGGLFFENATADRIELRGEANGTILQGYADSRSRRLSAAAAPVITVGHGVVLTLRHLTIEHGAPAIAVVGGTLTLIDCTLRNNSRALQLIAASPARGVRVTLRVRESGSRRRALAATRDSDGREHGRHAGG